MLSIGMDTLKPVVCGRVAQASVASATTSALKAHQARTWYEHGSIANYKTLYMGPLSDPSFAGDSCEGCFTVLAQLSWPSLLPLTMLAASRDFWRHAKLPVALLLQLALFR